MKEVEKKTLAQAIQLIKKGKSESAANILIPLLRNSPDIAMAWAIFFQATDSLNYKHKALQEVLRLRPDDQWAITQLQTLPPLDPPKPAFVPTPPPIIRPPAPSAPEVAPVTLSEHKPNLPKVNILPSEPLLSPGKIASEPSEIDWNPETLIKKKKPKTRQHVPKWLWGVALIGLVSLLIVGSVSTWRLFTNPTKAMEIEAITAAQTVTNLLAEADYNQLAPISCAAWQTNSPQTNFDILATQFGYKIPRERPLPLTFSVAEISRKEATVYVSGFFPEMGEVNPMGTGIFTLQREGGEWKWCGAESGQTISP